MLIFLHFDMTCEEKGGGGGGETEEENAILGERKT
jgi:hypothetical protein